MSPPSLTLYDFNPNPDFREKYENQEIEVPLEDRVKSNHPPNYMVGLINSKRIKNIGLWELMDLHGMILNLNAGFRVKSLSFFSTKFLFI